MKNAFSLCSSTGGALRKARLPRAAFFAAAVTLGTLPAHAVTVIPDGELGSRYDIGSADSQHELAYGVRAYRDADQELVRINAKGVTLDIQGLLENVGTGQDSRAIRTNNNGNSRGVMTLIIGSAGNATACVSSSGNDAIQLRDYATAIIHNYGTIQAVGNNADAGQAIDLDKKMDNNAGGVATIHNYSSGIIRGVAQEAIKAGGNTTILNSGLIQTATLAQNSFKLSSAISAKEDGASPRRENLTVENAVGGRILGGKHGITGEGVAGISNFGLIEGFNGSGLNWDLVPGDAPYTVTIVNGSTPGDSFAVIRGGLESANVAVDADGDGIDLDALGDITNYGLVESTRSNRSSDAISIGGGTLRNLGGTIRSSNSNTDATTDNATSVYGINVTGVDGARATTFGALSLQNQGGLIEATGANAIAIKINGTLDDVIENAPLGGKAGIISADGIAILTIFDNDISDSDTTDTGSKTIINRSGALITARGAHAIKLGKGTHTLTNEAGATIETTTPAATATLYLVNGGTIDNSGKILAASAAADAILLGGDTDATVNILGAEAEIRGNITARGTGRHSVNFDPGANGLHVYTGTLFDIARINILSGEVALARVVGAEKITVQSGASLLMDTLPDGDEFEVSGSFTLNLDTDGTMSAALTGSGNFIKTGDGTLTLLGESDTYTGGFNLAQGGLEIDGDATLGDPASGGGIVVASRTTTGISGTLNGGLTFSNTDASALVQLRGGSINANTIGEAVVFDASEGTLKISNHRGVVTGDIVARNGGDSLIQVDVGSRFGRLNTFTLDGSILTEDSATLELEVRSGALQLTGNGSNYAGTTIVHEGAGLLVSNTTGSATGTSRVTVENGAMLKGTGRIAGNGNANGILISGTISPGDEPGDVGTLTFNGPARFTNATLAVDIASPASYDTLIVNDALTLSGSANKILISEGTSPGEYDIVTASSISGYRADSFEKITGVASDGYSLVRGSGVVLDETSTPTLRLILSTSGALGLTWTGAQDSVWGNASTAANWTDAGGVEFQYRDGDSVTFSDAGAGTVDVDMAGVLPAAMVFTHNSGSEYFFTGGDIGASAATVALTVSSGGDVTFDNGTFHFGRVTVTGGSLAFTENAQVRLYDAVGIELSGGTFFSNTGVVQNRRSGDGDGLRLVAGAGERVGVVNAFDATIRGSDNAAAINIQGVNADIENDGRLIAPAGTGVRMEGDGTQAVYFLNNATGEISGGAGGIAASGINAEIVNRGQISSDSGPAIAFTGSGAETLLLSNSAGAEISGATGGMHVSGGNAQITNRGVIVADSGAAVFLGAGESSFTIAGDAAEVRGDIVAEGAGAKTLHLNPTGRFSGGGRFDYTGKISGRFAEVKITGDVVSLSGASDYTGVTTVGAGAMLIASNVAGSATGASTVVVETGGTLAGTGTLSGPGETLPGSGAGVRIHGTLAPGDGTPGGTGTLTFGCDVLLSDATLALDLISTSVHDKISVNGIVHFEGLTTVDYSLNIFGTFNILTASGGITGDLVFAPITGTGLDGYSLARGNASGAGGLHLGEDGKTLRLVVSSEGVLDLVWTGVGGNTWINATSQENWTGAAGAENKFRNGDHVTFSDAGAGMVAIDAAGVAPGSVRFTNTSGNDYTVNGSIRGNESIAVTGGGGVALAGDNSGYTGALTLDNGSELVVSGNFNGSINATSGTALYNEGDITSADGISVGTGVPGASFYLQNTGTIAAAASPALVLDGDFDGEIVNRGVMSGGALAVRLGAGRHTLTNRGTLAAAPAGGVAVHFEAGESVLNVMGESASIIGDITGAADATKTINFSPSGRAALNAPGIFSYDGSIRGENFEVNIASGAVVLGGTASDYTGLTTVRAGATLYATNASGSATGASRVVVESDAVLAGTGALRGAGTAGITVRGTLAPGDTLDTAMGGRLPGIGTLRLDGRVIVNNATIEIGIAPGGLAHDCIISDGEVNFRGANTILFQPETLGIFDIVSAASVSTGSEDNPASFNKITGHIGGYSLTRGSGFRVSEDGTKLQLVVSNEGALDLVWTGADGNAWVNAPTAANWASGDGEETQYRDGDRVLFSGSGAATVAIDAAGVAPGSVRFENIAGSARTINGIIRGDAAVIVTGGGSATLSGQNAYTGGTRVENGTLVAAQENALGTGDVVVLAAGRLESAAARITGDVENAGVAQLGRVTGSVRNTGTLLLDGNGNSWGALHNAGTLDFVAAGRTLTVAALHGIAEATGSLHMDVNLNEPSLSDKLVVSGALTGKHQLLLTDVSPNQNTITRESGTAVKLIEAPNADFADATVSGQLVTELYIFPVVADATQDAYILGSASGGGDGGGTPQISPGAQAIVNTSSAVTFAWFSQLDNLGRRMGELHSRANATTGNDAEDTTNGLRDFWIRTHGQRVNTDIGTPGMADFAETQYGADIGFDQRYAPTDDVLVYIGIFLGYQGARRSFHDGFSGTGSTDSIGGGFYASVIHQDGWYLDATLKAQRFQNKYDVEQLGIHGSFENTAAGFSLEGGKRVDFAGTWFIEPSVQLAFAHVFANNYTTRHGLAVALDDADVTRFGAAMRLGHQFALPGGAYLQPSLRLGVEHQNGQGGAVSLAHGTERFSPKIDGWQVNLGLGVSWQLDPSQQVHFNYEASFGDKYEKPWGLSLSYRKNF